MAGKKIDCERLESLNTQLIHVRDKLEVLDSGIVHVAIKANGTPEWWVEAEATWWVEAEATRKVVISQERDRLMARQDDLERQIRDEVNGTTAGRTPLINSQ